MSQEIPCLISSPTNILTIQDAVLDSPVWRANILHLQDQIDQFEKWIDSFLRALKSYIEALTKYNTQATTLCKKTFFNGLDGTLIDAKIAGNVVSQFATTLQSMVAYKMKTVSDLEDQLLNPLQKMVKNDLKNFKDSRKQFEKVLDKYEGQLNRYSLLSKQKEASALREDAFQMYELRKLYVKNSGDYFSKLVSFKSNLENLLVECFSSALNTHVEEIDESVYTCTTAKTNLPGWKQWLEESKSTCDYQINKMNKRCHELQELYFEQSKPPRQLKRYSTINNDQMSAVSPEDETSDKEVEALASLDVNTVNTMKSAPSITINEKSGNKEGYLNCRIIPGGKSTRPPWTRKWVVLHSGWLGTCTVSTINKEKGCIILGERVNITECVFRVCTDIDRRYCFEVVHPKCSYYLQAETEQEIQQWLWAIEYNMESSAVTPVQQTKPTTPQVLLSPHAVMSSSSLKNTSSSSPHLIAMSTSPLPSPDGSQADKCLLAPIITTTSSLTDLMIREGEDHNIIPEQTAPTTSTISQQLSSWGMPWLTNGISSALSNTEEDVPPSPTIRSSTSASTTMNNQQLIIWPNKLEMDVPIPNLSHYSTELETSQKELRKLFDNVPKDDIVLDAFLASLYKKSSDEESSFGYSGHVYVTQKSLWFYSCTIMTCVNMVVIPLVKIENIRLDNNSLLVIDIQTHSPCSLGLWLESPEVVLERLKLIVDNVKQNNTDIQSIYDLIRNIKPTKKNKTPASHVTTSSTLYATVTPVNVQAHQQPMQKTNSSSTTGSIENNDSNEEENNHEQQQQQHQGSPAQGALTAVYQNAVKQKQQKNNSIKRNSSPLPAPPPPAATESTKEEKEEEWPSHIPKPKKQVKCQCNDHLEKIESDNVFPISAKKLYELMFISDLWNKLNKQKNYGEPTLTEWKETDTEGVIKERTMSYIMPVTNPMVKAKETDVIETQQLLEYRECVSYVVMMMTRTPNLPYADAFVPCIKYCITYVTPTSCRLVSSIGVNWLKSIFVKGMVNRAATKGMQETIQALTPLLKQQVQQINHESNGTNSSNNEKKKEETVIPEDKPIPPPKDTTTTKKQNGFTVFFGLICVLFVLYQFYISKRYENNLHLYRNNTTMIWRGVYLRDIQDEITEKEATLNQVNYHTYTLFQQARKNGTTQQWKQPWFSKQHKMVAQELGYSRERLGSIRYELLSTFRILNNVEYQLLENEYLNWLGDQKLRCQKNNNKPSKELCKEFQQEISSASFV